jgi:hypothetical protein
MWSRSVLRLPGSPGSLFFDIAAAVLWRGDMRNLILCLSLALASCGGKQAADNTAVSEESGAADVTAVNDTTAIDAATGEAANMAANVNYSFNEEETNATANTSSNTSTAKPARKPSPAPAPSHEPDEPATPTNTAE